MKLNNKTVLITGAGSGIGQALAIALAKRGCHLALVDQNEKGLEKTVELLAAFSIRISQHMVDVTDKQALKALPAEALKAHQQVDILINNAGVAVGGSFLQVSETDFDWLIDINFNAVVRLTRYFLSYMQKLPEAMIVNISSLYGLISPVGETAYCASKFAVRGFSNALRHELNAAGSNVHICVVHPGGIATDIANNARISEGISEEEILKKQKQMEKLLRMPPQEAGEIIVKGMERNKARILVGSDAKIISFIERLFPVSYGRLLT